MRSVPGIAVVQRAKAAWPVRPQKKAPVNIAGGPGGLSAHKGSPSPRMPRCVRPWALADQGRTIRIPGHIIDRLKKVVRASQSLTVALARQPLPEEIAAALAYERPPR